MKKLIAFLLIFNVLCAHELPIVVVIPSYNNIDWYEKNLSSVLSQNYENYTVIYIDDCSQDGTGQAVREFINTHDPSGHIRLIQNKYRKGALANHWHAVHQCNPNVIIVNLDGDDWFAHPNVLKRVNEAYADGNTAATYGQYVEYPSMQPGHCRQLPYHIAQKNAWRRVPLPLPTSHLRTFKAGLFQTIKLEDLLINDDFFPAAGDVAFFFSVLEQAGIHVKFIPEVLYVYNNETPINDYKIRLATQLNCFQYIRNKQPYRPLENPVDFQEKEITVDVCIITDHLTEELKENITRTIKNIGNVYSAVSIQDTSPSTADYILIMKKNDVVTRDINVQEIAQMLCKTHITHCYIDYHVNNAITLFDRFKAWRFNKNTIPAGPVMIKKEALQEGIHPAAHSLCLSVND